MKRILTALAAALLLAITSVGAVPAHARDRDDRNRDAAAAILGITALGLLLSQSNQYRDNDWTPDRGYFYDDGNQSYGYRKQRRHRVLPSECVIGLRFDGRYREVLSGRCLSDYGLGARVPDACAFDVRYRGRYRTVYEPSCLRDYGYRIGSFRD